MRPWAKPKTGPGAKLQRMRRGAGKTLREMSKRTKLSISRLCDVENNRRPPTPKILAAYMRLKEK